MSFRTHWLSAIISLALIWSPARSEDSLVDLASFRDGCQALVDGRYETAAESFLATWKVLEKDGAGDIERDLVASRLLESLVRDQRSSEAVAWLEKLPYFDESRTTLEWTARAYRLEGRYSEAAAAYDDLASRVADAGRSVTIERALCLSLSGEEDAGFSLINGTIEPLSPDECLLFAQLAGRSGNREDAGRYLEKLDTADSQWEVPFETRFAALSYARWIETGLGLLPDTPPTLSTLEKAYQLVMEAPSKEAAHRSFLLLEEISAGRFNETEIDSLAAAVAEGHPATEAAGLFLPLFRSEPEDDIAHLDSWLTHHPDGPLADEAKLRISEYSEERIAPWQSAPEFPGGEDRIRFELATSDYRNDRFEEALDGFASIGKETKEASPEIAALANAAISALQAGDEAEFEKRFSRLQSMAPDSTPTSRLGYVAGLRLASRGEPGAIPLLESFVRTNPEEPGRTEARLALAELFLNQVPSRPQAAGEILTALRSYPLTLEQNERLDYDAVWLNSISGNEAGLITSGEDFLRDWPNSSHFADIAMLVARQHTRDDRIETARDLYDEVAKKFPESEVGDRAEFFAAKTTPLGEDALARWTSLSESGGNLAPQARHEKGLLLLALDRFDEARDTFRTVIEGEETPTDLRFAARADSAFSHYAEALANEKNPEMLEQAAKRFAELSRDQAAPDPFRFEASVRRGKCLEALGRPEVALEIYESLVSNARVEGSLLLHQTDPRTTQWIYRAGFSAVEILRQREDWKLAIETADALSKNEGPRALEAARLAERMRLEHWIWE